MYRRGRSLLAAFVPGNNLPVLKSTFVGLLRKRIALSVLCVAPSESTKTYFNTTRKDIIEPAFERTLFEFYMALRQCVYCACRSCKIIFALNNFVPICNTLYVLKSDLQ